VAGASALVLFSGGQDSTVCLAWALERYARVETLGFAYGQRHEVELIARARVVAAFRGGFPRWSERLGDDLVLELATLGQISDTSLTRDAAIEITAAGLPSTFVPGRNVLFFTYAAALAYRRGIRTLIGGMCETDYTGYPDCRNDTLQTLARALSLGMATEFTIETPLMWIDKAGTWALADNLGGRTLVDIILEHTHTCYLGDHERRHDWGYGCGTCPACSLRATGWQRWRSGRT
jgi:7-cyano-7-deazaguanine synthase